VLVKGVSVASTRDFVKEKFGENGFEKWLKALSPGSKEIFAGHVHPNQWYPPKESISVPTKTVCDVFYKGHVKGAHELGMHSAEAGVKGLTRFFLRFASPGYVMERGGKIFTGYYKPSALSVIWHSKNSGTLNITKFDGIDKYIEHRISGWIERMLRMCGSPEVKVTIKSSMAKGDKSTEFFVEWK
jgi:hypothetical protein